MSLTCLALASDTHGAEAGLLDFRKALDLVPGEKGPDEQAALALIADAAGLSADGSAQRSTQSGATPPPAARRQPWLARKAARAARPSRLGPRASAHEDTVDSWIKKQPHAPQPSPPQAGSLAADKATAGGAGSDSHFGAAQSGFGNSGRIALPQHTAELLQQSSLLTSVILPEHGVERGGSHVRHTVTLEVTAAGSIQPVGASGNAGKSWPRWGCTGAHPAESMSDEAAALRPGLLFMVSGAHCSMQMLGC